ncbi:MAG: NAD-dependent DNA ligase LigA [Eubacterium sp.]|nr:NAD-dependent DNA ligase LigA [Eubacterium sp.]
MEKKNRIKFLVETLNEAAKAYYREDREIMSNFEYDKLYDELTGLEEETGIVMASSPTVNVGYEVLSSLPKEPHGSRMLSLDKTKDVEQLKQWLADQKGLLSWKLDGLTVVLTYEDGIMTKAVTRGNGDIGEVITNNAKVFKNLPLKIPFKGKLVLRGEAFIKYSDFERINEEIPDIDAKYKNPRNLCSGSVRQLNNQITAERNVNFKAFALGEISGADSTEILENTIKNSRINEMEFLRLQGFETVEGKVVTGETLQEAVNWFAEAIEHMDIPSDGLVLILDDIAYGLSLGNTAKFPRNAIAFKWRDEIKETKLVEIEWSPSRTGLINPVAIFEPVELEGTTVSRASVHNISIVKELQLGIGDTIKVYKANMIIPQIEENVTRSGNLVIPDTCPACGGKTEIKNDSGIETLICTNEHCPAKMIKSFALFVGRDGMNIEKLSEATLEKFIGKGFIREYSDLFNLERHREEIVAMEGFGEKSYSNLAENIEKAKDTTVSRVLYSLGVPGIGVANAKVIAKAAEYSWDKVMSLDFDQLTSIDGIGDIMAKGFVDYFADTEKKEQVKRLVQHLRFEDEGSNLGEQDLNGKVFVVTGSLNHFENRNALKAEIENRGGKVTGSVSSKTDYLINNDTQSTSSKNKKAKELGIPIISEEDFLKL